MTAFKSSKERVRVLPETQNIHEWPPVLAATDVLDDLTCNEFKDFTLSDSTSCPYTKCHYEANVSDCLTVKSSNYIKENVNHRTDMFDNIEPHVSQSSKFKQCNTENLDIKVKCNNIMGAQSPSQSFIANQKHVINSSPGKSNKSPNSSNTFTFEHILNRARSSNLLKSKSLESVKEEIHKEQLSPWEKQDHSSLKRTDNIPPIQMKTKLRSMWNNMKYGWRVKREVNLKVDSAAWLLGRCYHNKLNDGAMLSQDVSKQLKLDLLSKIWLTYRINFPTIPGTEFVSDSGWGCMLRCGQMMMAQALVCHFLHRDWRISPDQPEETKHLYKMIIRWFGDSLSDANPFSLHHLVSLGENYGRKAGDWYGPTHAAQVLRDALLIFQKHHPQLRDVCMYVALDGIVFKQDIVDLCSESPIQNLQSANAECKEKENLIFSSDNFDKRSTLFSKNISRQETTSTAAPVEEYIDKFDDACPSYSEFGPPSFNTAQTGWKSLILFVSVRLGNDKINPFYIPCLKSLLAYEHCIGIIGGRPKHALYFIGYQEEKLIHMDPHSCQPAVDVEKEDFNEKSFHSSSIRTISFSEMDPSCAIGFYFRLKKEFDHFVEKFSEITAPMKRNLDYPVFALAEGRRIDIEEIDSFTYTRSSFSSKSGTSYKDEDDDYILL